MHSSIESDSVSKGSLWAGRIVSGLVVLFMTFDGVTKVMKTRQVIEATDRIGFPESNNREESFENLGQNDNSGAGNEKRSQGRAHEPAPRKVFLSGHE
jgi:hypothetical protein